MCNYWKKEKKLLLRYRIKYINDMSDSDIDLFLLYSHIYNLLWNCHKNMFIDLKC